MLSFLKNNLIILFSEIIEQAINPSRGFKRCSYCFRALL